MVYEGTVDTGVGGADDGSGTRLAPAVKLDVDVAVASETGSGCEQMEVRGEEVEAGSRKPVGAALVVVVSCMFDRGYDSGI